MSRYSNDLNAYFEFDSKTGDMVLRLGDNSTYFDNFRERLVGGDLGLEEKQYNQRDYSNLVDHDPEEDFGAYRGDYDPDRYHYGDTALLKAARAKKHKELNFSIASRKNAKQKFRFWEHWTASVNKIEVTNKEKGVISTYPRTKWVKPGDPDFPEDAEEIKVSKETSRDSNWVHRVLRNGYIYF